MTLDNDPFKGGSSGYAGFSRGPAGEWQQDLDQVCAPSTKPCSFHSETLFPPIPSVLHTWGATLSPLLLLPSPDCPEVGLPGSPEGRNSAPAASPQNTQPGQPTCCLVFSTSEGISQRCISQAGPKSEG